MGIKRKKQSPVCLLEPVSEPFALVIFGASGDLTKRKLIPALFNLYKESLVPERFFILGTARTEYSSIEFRDILSEYVTTDAFWQSFKRHLFFQPIDYNDRTTYITLRKTLKRHEKTFQTKGNRLFYLAVPPQLAEDIVKMIGESGLAESEGWKRIVVEKPFGWDLPSAKRLNELLQRYFKEEEIFRIDHYLGKETVQDILLFRFANSIFEPIWNRNFIDHVQITASESIGVEKRAGYYERAGIIRDMFQNHILQLMSLIAMEPPALFEPARIREEKVKVFRSLREITRADIPEYAVFGQYIEGVVDGQKVVGYRDEEGVRKDSHTPTFAALKVFIDNWRWQGVPFYLRSGKRLKRRVTEVSIHFKTVPHSIFKNVLSDEIKPNVLVFRIQPDEAIELTFQTKIPGTTLCFREVTMNFSYRQQDHSMPEAYERVLMDCLRGDHLIFVGQEGVERAWEFFTPILKFLDKGKKLIFHINDYRAGTWGPPEAEEFIRRDGRQWWVR